MNVMMETQMMEMDVILPVILKLAGSVFILISHTAIKLIDLP